MAILIITLVLALIAVASLAYALNPVFGVALLAAVILVAVFGHWIEFGLLAFLFSIPIDRCGILLEGIGLTVTKVIIAFTMLGWIIRTLITKDSFVIRTFFSSPTAIFVILYLMSSTLSIAVAQDYERVFEVLVRRTFVIIFFFFIINLIRDKKLLYRGIDMLLVSSLFICLVGFYEMGTGNPILSKSSGDDALFITAEGGLRVQACSGNPDFHAAILAMLLPFVVYRFLTLPRGKMKVAVFMLGVLFIVNILATQARLGTLGMAIVFGVFFIFGDFKHKFLKLSVVGFITGAAFIILSSVPGLMTAERYTGDSGMQSIEYRVGWIIMAWEMVKDNPVTGVGVGNYVSEYRKYAGNAVGMVPYEPIIHHNGIMQVWAENGTPGLIILLLMLASVPFYLFRNGRVSKDEHDLRTLEIAVLAAFLVFVMCIGVIPALEHEVGWMIMALAIVIGSLKRQRAMADAPIGSLAR